MNKIILYITFCFFIVNGQNIQKGDYGYLFCHMSDLGEYTAFAISRDGYNYEDIIGGKAIMDVNAHARIEGGQRDAYITRSYDGKGFVMVNTDMCVAKTGRWTNYGIDLLKSDDLIHWTSVAFYFGKGVSIFMEPESQSVYKDFSTINKVWVPQIFWDQIINGVMEIKGDILYIIRWQIGTKKVMIEYTIPMLINLSLK